MEAGRSQTQSHPSLQGPSQPGLQDPISKKQSTKTNKRVCRIKHIRHIKNALFYQHYIWGSLYFGLRFLGQQHTDSKSLH